MTGNIPFYNKIMMELKKLLKFQTGNNVLTFTFTATDYDNFAFEYLLIDE
jgi:hypothetical protein